MASPQHALLPFLMASILGCSVAHAQELDGEQDAPTQSQLLNINPPSPNVTFLQGYEYGVSVDQGWTGQLMQEANRLRQESVIIEGPAPNRTLRLGDKGDDVQWLIEALIARGYLSEDNNPLRIAPPAVPYATPNPEWNNGAYSPAVPAESEYTTTVDTAVRAFQADSGLKEDGVAGKGVYSALTVDNTALANALDSWANNVGSWANEARAAGHDRMIVVNIPSFTLHAIDLTNNEEIIQSRVIVGKPYTRTPLMMTRVVNLKANPDWSPPKSIRGARYQRPGPNNALGLMRFSTDNNMSIYLHDTNARGLFANDARALSHGCVRVQEWHSLAAWAARQDETWVDEVALVGGKTRFLKVDAIPVVISYSLVDLVEGNARQFGDVYSRGSMAIGHAALQGHEEPPVISWTQRN